MPVPSIEKRTQLYAAINRSVRMFIAGSSLFSQRIAEKLGLHPTDLQFLNILELMGPTTPKVLAQFSGLSSGGVTVVLGRLEKAGYVRRLANPVDGRSVLVEFSPAKRRKVTSHYDSVEAQFVALIKDSPLEELEVVAAFFAKMNAARPPAS